LLAAWGNIGSLLGGLAAVALAIAAIITGSAGLGDWRAKQRAEAELVHAEAEPSASSSTRTFDAAEEEIVAFRCTGKRLLPIFLASIVGTKARRGSLTSLTFKGTPRS
jgi:hypothetical protein